MNSIYTRELALVTSNKTNKTWVPNYFLLFNGVQNNKEVDLFYLNVI